MPTSTRDRIVDAAAGLFMERGYAASGLKDISSAGTAPIGSLYHFFPGGKEELAAAALRVAGARYQALVERIFDGAPDLLTGVRWCYEGAAATLRATDFADACPVATVALEVASTNDALREVTAEVFGAWIEAAAARIEAAAVPSDQARRLAIVLIAALEGGFLLSRAAKDTAPMAAVADAMVALVGHDAPGRGVAASGGGAVEDVLAVVTSFGEACNAHDLEAALALCAADVVFEGTRPPDGERVVGRTELRKVWAPIFANAASHVEVEESIVAGDRVVQRCHYSWGDGHVRAVDLYRVTAGRIAEKLSYVKG